MGGGGGRRRGGGGGGGEVTYLLFLKKKQLFALNKIVQNYFTCEEMRYAASYFTYRLQILCKWYDINLRK